MNAVLEYPPARNTAAEVSLPPVPSKSPPLTLVSTSELAPDPIDLTVEQLAPRFIPHSRPLCRDESRWKIPGWWGNFRGILTSSKEGVEQEERRRPRKTRDVALDAPDLAQSAPFRRLSTDLEAGLSRAERLNAVLESTRIEKITQNTVLYRYDVPVKNLPPELEGFAVLHLSDLHFQPTNLRRLIEIRALAHYLQKQAYRVDVVAATGDFITDFEHDLNSLSLKTLNKVAPSAMRLAVLGNHDYYGGSGEYVTSALESIGYQVLGSPSSSYQVPGTNINFFGIDDYLEGVPIPPHRAEENADGINILLTHHLDAVRANCPDVFDIMLSGHLHAGEVWGGMQIMKVFGYTQDINRQVVGWDGLSERALSFISPGHSQHWFRFGVAKPGAALIRLVTQD